MKIKAMWVPTGKTAGLNVYLVGHILLFILLYSFMFDNVTTTSLYFIICAVIVVILKVSPTLHILFTDAHRVVSEKKIKLPSIMSLLPLV